MTSHSPPLRAVTRGPKHHFFGYYDKCPWDRTQRYLLGLEVDFLDRPPTAEDRARIGLIDTAAGNTWHELAETRAWSWQQGNMLQWLPSAPDREVIYNDREGDQFVSVILDVHTGRKRTLPRPIYAVSRNGQAAVSLNFARLQHLRPGYGYAGPRDPWCGVRVPEDDGVYWMDLRTGENRLILPLARLVRTEPDPCMEGVKHWVNHLAFNTDNTRISFLHRWQNPDRGWHTRLVTAIPDGTELCCLTQPGMFSHYDWRDPSHVLGWATVPGAGTHFFLFTDRTAQREVVGSGVLVCDGHCSYSPDGRWVLTDTYPDARQRRRRLMIYDPSANRAVEIGAFHAPLELDGEIRCDLHPRWSRDGHRVCLDSVHEGSRQMYTLEVDDLVR